MYKIKTKLRQISNTNSFVKRIYRLLNTVYISLTKYLSDTKFAKIKYKQNTGKTLSLDNPQTFNEKLWWLKIHNRDPLLTVCSDKVLVRDYVISKGLGFILTNLFGVYSSPKDIPFDRIPNNAYIKTNHESGNNMIYNKSNFDYKHFVNTFTKSLHRNYFYQSREWNYKNIVPKILVEENLNPFNEFTLVDYRFLCFDGKVKYVFIDIDTAAADGSHYYNAKRNVFDKEGNLLEIKAHRDNFDPNLFKKPDNWDDMITYAEILSEPFIFCRVDLYNIKGKIYFGEITFYPGGATQSLQPNEYEYTFGSMINLSSKKIKIIGE